MSVLLLLLLCGPAGAPACQETHTETPHQRSTEIILFPKSVPTCLLSGYFTYNFWPSASMRKMTLFSARFWLHAGEERSKVWQVYMSGVGQQLIRAATGPGRREADGWQSLHVAAHILRSIAHTPFTLWLRWPDCRWNTSSEIPPFLHVHGSSQPRLRRSLPRVPWSPSTVEQLQRPTPSHSRSEYACQVHQLNISVRELGWDTWILQPEVFTFHFCYGNCSTAGNLAVGLGIKQCCVPVPRTMKSLSFRTSSDGGYTVKHETLPSILAADCMCV